MLKKCAKCREKGASIGCFEPSCNKSYHLKCSGKSHSHFENGVVFWCPRHENQINLSSKCFDEVGEKWYVKIICDVIIVCGLCLFPFQANTLLYLYIHV